MALARENQDYELVALTCQNLGVVAQMLGDLSTPRARDRILMLAQ